MAKVDWYDEILIEKVARASCLVTRSSDEPRATSDGATIELICKGEYKVPEGEENLVYKAARLILETARQKDPLRPEGYAEQAEDEMQNIEHPTSNSEHRTKEKLVCIAHPTNGEAEDPALPKCYAEASGRENIEHPTSNLEPRTKMQLESGKQGTGVKITLTKNVPAGAGLGSGSSDAAATLMGVNKFLKLGLSKNEINRLAAELGSDVAFFLDGPMALCTGRGEKVKKIQGYEFRALLIVPDVSVSTKRVYENYRHDEAKYRRLSEEIKIYIEKKRVDLVSRMCANMLQESCFESHPELKELKNRIESLGIRPVCLSGSGSSMFCIIDGSNEEGVRTYQKKLADNYIKSIIVKNNTW
jgi:4-diphosphocytidyl-2C-methyl-D-erythritol kinase